MPNKYHCTLTGKSYSEATIQSNLSTAYKEFYMFEPLGSCEGCQVVQAQNTAHILPKARLKQLRLTSLIWNPIVWFRSCIRCNQIAENPSSDEIKKLKNFDRILEVTKKFDPERYQLML